ncbi:hypothetical protein DXV76_03515 [Rhodobacteraceae bacterium CCMM004]|nr:hypothetical protein DXV76_03515 [Rhodobacteraceae bacterium CCMM004]
MDDTDDDKGQPITQPDGSPLRDKDNAAMTPKPDFAQQPAPNLAPPGMGGIVSRRSNPAPQPQPTQVRDLQIGPSQRSATGFTTDGRIVSMPGYSFVAHLRDTPSSQALYNGRIDQLVLKKDDQIIARYNVGWRVPPRTVTDNMAVHRICTGLDDSLEHAAAKKESAIAVKPGEPLRMESGAYQTDGSLVSMPGYSFVARIEPERSQQGIEGGKITRLDLRKDGATVASFNRGWDKMPKTAEQVEAVHRIRQGFGDVRPTRFQGFDTANSKDHGHSR